MKPSVRHLGLALLVLSASCNAPEGDHGAAPPAAPHATAVLRSKEIRIADRPEIDIVVTTAPGWRLQRLEPPESLAGFEIVDWRRPPVVREPRRWLHHQRVQLRAIETGNFVWPPLPLTVANENGAPIELELPPIALVVGSIMDEHPQRDSPFGARAAPDPYPARPSPSRRLAAAFAALLLASTALILLVKRRSRIARSHGTPPTAPWSAALAELDRAAELSERPAEASHLAAGALRGYMAGRFGARTRMHTSEELASCEPPYGAISYWPTFAALLQEFDELRFRPAESDVDDRSSADFTSKLARARAFVAATTPPAGLQ